ncbi:MAG: response regulator, partial [Actinomycetia bacterium]|nr:response regulator [Actinomycetes bacterium]
LMRVGVEDRNPGSITLRFEIEATSVDGVAGNGARPIDADQPEGEATPEILLDRGVLGMPIALETVSRMGGHVTVDGDREDHAAVQFTIRLQMSDADGSVRPVLDDRTPMEGPVLVIADTVDTRRSTAEMLDATGLPYEIMPSVTAWMSAHGGHGALNTTPAVVVIDSSKDSFAECDTFKELVPAQIPIVVVVASGSRGDAAQCRDRGVRGYLARPLDPGDLVDVIRATMALSSSGNTTTLVTRHWLREGRSSLHVLVVDDSTTNRYLLTRMLDQRGHSTVTACDGAEAVAASRENSFDVVLMDVMMPVMDGLEATRRIRKMHDEPTDRPFIVGVSAFVDQTSIDRANSAGMDAFLAKPVRPDDLFVVVEQRRTPELTV